MATATTKRKDNVNNLGVHGYLIVISAFLLYMIGCGVVTDLLNVSITAITELRPALNSTLLLSSSTVASWVTLVVALFMGKVIEKFGCRYVMTISTFIFAVACFCMGMVTANWQYIILIVVVGICDATQSGMAMQTIISRWFPTKKGVVMGWATCGLTAATAVLLPFFNWCIAKVGITKAYWIIALIALATCIYNFIVIRDVPEALGIAPDNDPNTDTSKLQEEAAKVEEYMKSSPWTFAKLLKTKEMWMISCCLGVGMMVATGIFSQFVPRMASYGVSVGVALTMMSVGVIVSVPFSYGWGVLDAKFGPKWLTTIMLSWYLVGIIIMIVCGGNVAGSMVGFLIFESALGGINNMLTSYTTTVFGRYDFQSANKLIYPIYNAIRGAAFGLIAISTALFSGSYTACYVIMACALVVAIIVSLFLKSDCIGRTDEDMQKDIAK